MTHQLALHGGTKVRTTPFTPWPVFDEAEEEAVLDRAAERSLGAAGRRPGDCIRSRVRRVPGRALCHRGHERHGRTATGAAGRGHGGGR